MSGTGTNVAVQLVVATVLAGVGLAGIASVLLGSALFDPAYAAVAFGAAAAVYPGSPGVDGLRDRLSG
jgi:hypothetical protein